MSTRPEPPLARLAWLGMAGLALALLFLSPAVGQQPSPAPLAGPAAPPPIAEPGDYRMDAYRAPTPATLKGAVVLDTPAAQALWRDKAALFVDVMPRDVKPANLPAGTIWRDKKRDHLPGSVWLPNVGYGALSPEMDAYFRRSLTELSADRKDAVLVFYCMTDCWMSWNAARRALAYGYTGVAWYPAGADGWAKAGLPLEPATPRE
ncbi:PQQ-dependent catabolism-associated CXXCW motif protein [Angulomicrobium tetraedrale]|uniref:PQQ-dependent catabolism-associated CXXCW motif protein n=1 Tax=Ancylobacter tetraedralis TaxID=217068 RepID=A0A839Z713_9HYPH|nr:PQQ-dependent catabolism-associated CXXCW motif protein [Ancylobacter tetraedralis]MBB3770186.1 PQQ-dependent catabolism-associated CXXCW motif protein [Ancylobacter tetraedralis]